MLAHKKYTFINPVKGCTEVVSMMPSGSGKKDNEKKLLKKELIEVFRKFGYLGEKKDYEVNIKTTSGNIAWININSIETIK